jgi:hypothetical protein
MVRTTGAMDPVRAEPVEVLLSTSFTRDRRF